MRTAGPPREQLRSQNVVPSWPVVALLWTHHPFFSCTWPLVFAARSTAVPSAVQYCHQLKFQSANWYTDAGCSDCSPNHVLQLCWSACRRKPRSFGSKPAERRW